MTNSPAKILVFLLLIALGVSGWFYGWHWKQVAIGAKPTDEEKLIIALQDQLIELRHDNDRLTEALHVSTDPPAGAKDEE